MNSEICMLAENSDNWMSDFWESKIEKSMDTKKKIFKFISSNCWYSISGNKILYSRNW